MRLVVQQCTHFSNCQSWHPCRKVELLVERCWTGGYKHGIHANAGRWGKAAKYTVVSNGNMRGIGVRRLIFSMPAPAGHDCLSRAQLKSAVKYVPY